MGQLNPCPFCGGKDLYNDTWGLVGQTRTDVNCRTCGAAGPTVDGRKGDAVAAWNDRKPGWISVKERNPYGYPGYLWPDPLLVSIPNFGHPYVDLATFDDAISGEWATQNGERIDPSHWQLRPLPAPPEDKP